MGRVVSRRGGAIRAPQRQIANDAVFGFATLTFGVSLVASAGGSLGLTLVESAATLVRSRGQWSASLTNNGTVKAHVLVVMGMIIVSSEAFGQGLASIPTPITDPERPWIIWHPLNLYGDATGDQPGSSELVAVSAAVDSRGMRKMKAGETLVLVFEAEQVSSTTGTVVNVAYNLRFQVKL